MNPELLLAFMGATAVLAFMPGPDNIFVLTESIHAGAKKGISITAGLVSGVVVHTLLVATGLSLTIFQVDWAYDVVKYAGALYLLYLAYGAWREEAAEVNLNSDLSKKSFWSLYSTGITMNLLNPKVAVFFIAFLPQFVSTDGWTPFYQMALMGVIFMVESFFIFSTIALLAGSFAKMINNPRFWLLTKYIKIIVLVSLAFLLAVSEQG